MPGVVASRWSRADEASGGFQMVGNMSDVPHHLSKGGVVVRSQWLKSPKVQFISSGVFFSISKWRPWSF